MKKMKFLFIVSVPFIVFLVGYVAAYFFLQKSYVVVPNILGKTVSEGGLLLGQRGLFLAILKEQEDPLVKDGTIVHQLPLAGQQSKFQKPVYVTIIKKSEIQRAPAFFGLGVSDIEALAKKTRLKPTIIPLAASYTSNVCFAQDPMPGERAHNGVVTIYVSSGSRQLKMVPDVRGMVYEEAIPLLAKAGIMYELFNVRDDGELLLPEHKIIDQRPRPGVFIEAEKALCLQIQVD